MIEKTYEGFLNIFNNRKQKIMNICEEYGIKNYTITKDGSIDVNGNVYLDNKKLTHLPLKFNRVSDSFFCYNNRLTSLEGAPKEVGGGFYCSNNRLTSLEGTPRKISHFDCSINKIWTFDGAPNYVTCNFTCYSNPIYYIWRLFQDYSKVELLNYCDPIREVDGKPAIVLERLNEFLEEIGVDPVEKVEEYINI